MATPIPTFPPRAKSTRYPWSLWLNGAIWQLRQGIDFTVTPKSFQSAAFARAKAMGKKLQTTISGDTITIQMLPWTEK
jgi:hypothetical protein